MPRTNASTVVIPASLDDAMSTLGGLDRLLHAKEWERAAIVYAFTKPQQGARNLGGTPTKLTIRAFAELGIAGLRHHAAVAFHRNQWERAMAAGYAEAKPGTKVSLPGDDLDWDDHDDEERNKRYTNRTPQAFAGSLNRGDVDAEEMVEQLDDATAERVIARLAEHRPQVVRPTVERVTLDQYERNLRSSGGSGSANELGQAARMVKPSEAEEAIGWVAQAHQLVTLAAGVVPRMKGDQHEIIVRNLRSLASAAMMAATAGADLDVELAKLLAGE